MHPSSRRPGRVGGRAFSAETTMKRMESGFFARGGFLLSMGFAFAAGPSWAATGSRLDFPPLKESSNAVPKTAESLRFPPLPFDSNVSTGAVPEPKAAKPAASVSGADILSAVGQDRKSPSVSKSLPGLADSSKDKASSVSESLPGLVDSSKDKASSVSESLPGLTKEQGGPDKSAAEILKSATVAPNEQSALSALAAAVSELPPTETAEPPEKEANDRPSPRKKRPPRPTESVAPASGVETDGKIVRVSVFIDVPFEEIKYPEGTAMLRTKNWLRKSFPELPDQFSVNGRVVENGFDDDDRVYRYRMEYDLEDIKRLLPSETAVEPVVRPTSEPDEPAIELATEPVAEQASSKANSSSEETSKGEPAVPESVDAPGTPPASESPAAAESGETAVETNATPSVAVKIEETPDEPKTETTTTP